MRAAGANRVLIVRGGSSARACGALDVVEGSLREARVPFETLEGIEPNPLASVVDVGVSMMRAFQLDGVVAVGGGSVMDVGKGIAGVFAGGHPARTYLSGIRENEAVFPGLPVVAVPTLPGSGSEVNGTCVLTDDLTGRKLSVTSDLWAPRFALVEPSWAALAPGPVLGGAIVDALCHALEAGLSRRATIGSDFLAAAAVRLLVERGRDAMDGDLQALAEAWWASIEAARALASAGSIVTHPMAHALSARLGMAHGHAVGLMEPVVLANLGEQMGPALTKVATWMGSRAATSAGRVRALSSRIETWCGDMGLAPVVRSAIDPAIIDILVDDVMRSGSRGLANTPVTTVDAGLVQRMFEMALLPVQV